MYKEGDFTPDALRNLKIGYETLFVEVPIVIKNSPLTNIMMSELSEMIPEEEGAKFLDLGTSSVLESKFRLGLACEMRSGHATAAHICHLPID